MARRRLVMGTAVMGSVAALGVPLGLLWWAIAPRPEVTVTGNGTTVPLPLSETVFASEGYFAIIMVCAGVACGYGTYLVQYKVASRHGTDLRLVCLVGLVIGAVAGSLVAWRVGVGLDSGAFERTLADAEPEEVVQAGLQLRALGTLLVWPFVCVLQYGLFDAVSIWRQDLPHQRNAEASGTGDPGQGDVGESGSGGAEEGRTVP
ncbi:hypothetical protein [Allosalinactinospora lopnorensis]|uniref:hypothetical protein n=1 Tax=Allosalinactinospora lopnorensis TaxID=1352348 RepID=UPI000623EFA2|nr:hypothetical protein [Allosalinactinospora lopnorensis]